MSSPSREDRRCLPERRQQPTSAWDTLWGQGSRMWLRRASERGMPHFVDRFSPLTLACVLALLSLSIADAWITIELVDSGCSEINPLMARLLDWGVVPFLAIKYVLTAAGLPILLLYKNYYLFGTRLRVVYLIPTFVAMYVALLAYQAMLLAGHIL